MKRYTFCLTSCIVLTYMHAIVVMLATKSSSSVWERKKEGKNSSWFIVVTYALLTGNSCVCFLMHGLQKRMRKKEIENETTFYSIHVYAQVKFQRVIHPCISNMCASQYCLWAFRSHCWLARERKNEKEWKRERNNNIGLAKLFQYFTMSFM